MPRKTRVVGAEVPEVAECVRVWPQEWQDKQLDTARLMLARRRKVRSQDDTPFIVRAFSVARALVPVVGIAALIVGYVMITSYAREHGTGNLDFTSTAVPTQYVDEFGYPCQGYWSDVDQYCYPAPPVNELERIPTVVPTPTMLPPLLGGS